MATPTVASTNCCPGLIQPLASSRPWPENDAYQLAITLAAALIGLEKLGIAHQSDWLVPVLIILLGTCGMLVTLKYTERADRHAVIARELRRELSKYISVDGLPTLEST